MSFEQSKSFELTKEEEDYLNGYIEKAIKIFELSKSIKPVRYLIRSDAAQVLAEGMDTRSEAHSWFFGRGALAAYEYIEVFDNLRGNFSFRKKLPDMSYLEFSEKDLREQLFNLGRFFFARQFDHTYESLVGVNKLWDAVDEYVRGRERQLRVDGIGKRLPELEGMI